ncbi:MAG: LLM class flavin-dependent oxidoreductase, partial [Chloroflexi bacterium]|nr:LLM class flavin-dependent oxidoreductase [Chloroflexota bacterium]
MNLGEEFVSAAGVMEVSRAAEAAGFDAVTVTDHPFPEDEWMRSGGHNALDPFVALSFAAAATTRLRLLTSIYVLPYRNPFLAAKSVASLDALSGGRVIFGIAAGYLEPEFEALGVSFDKRNELTDEAISGTLELESNGQRVTFTSSQVTRTVVRVRLELGEVVLEAEADLQANTRSLHTNGHELSVQESLALQALFAHLNAQPQPRDDNVAPHRALLSKTVAFLASVPPDSPLLEVRRHTNDRIVGAFRSDARSITHAGSLDLGFSTLLQTPTRV